MTKEDLILYLNAIPFLEKEIKPYLSIEKNPFGFKTHTYSINNGKSLHISLTPRVGVGGDFIRINQNSFSSVRGQNLQIYSVSFANYELMGVKYIYMCLNKFGIPEESISSIEELSKFFIRNGFNEFTIHLRKVKLSKI